MTIVIVKISISKVETAVLTNLLIFGKNSSHKGGLKRILLLLFCSSPSLNSPAKRKKRRGGKKKRLDALHAYHQRLVVEKGLPPRRLLHLQLSPLRPGVQKMQFKCDCSADGSPSCSAGCSHSTRNMKAVASKKYEGSGFKC